MSDYISRADAMGAVRKCIVESELLADWNKAMESAQELLSALPSAKQVTSKLKKPCDSLLTDDNDDSKEQKSKLDLISREDALQCKPEFLNPNPNDNPNNYPIGWNDAIKAWYAEINALPSADAVSREFYEEAVKANHGLAKELCELKASSDRPTVIRSKCFLSAEDFKKWAKRIREENPNAIVIPCDAEVVSTDAVNRDVYNKRTQADEEIIDSYRKEFQKALSADRPSGEWIDVHEDGHSWFVAKCSQCGKTNRINNYCPSCGAFMKGGNE